MNPYSFDKMISSMQMTWPSSPNPVKMRNLKVLLQGLPRKMKDKFIHTFPHVRT